MSSKHTFIHSNYVPELMHWKPGVLQSCFSWVIIQDCFPWLPDHGQEATGYCRYHSCDRSECLLPETWVDKTCLVPWHIVLDPSFYNSTVVSKSEVAQSCLTLCDPMDSSLHQAPPSMGFSRQEYWSGLPFTSPGNLPDPGIEPRSPTL